MSKIVNKQRGLKTTASRQGKGLHSGVACTLTLKPALENHGFVFKRIDLPGAPEIKADLKYVTATERGTVLTQGQASVATIEHLLGTLYGMGVDNVLIEMDGPEVPILDGSGQGWADAVREAGLVEQAADRKYLEAGSLFELNQGMKKASIKPADALTLSYFIDYQHSHLGQQRVRFDLGEAGFEQQVAPARTFCFEFEVEAMRKAGLIKGGGLDCALVIGDQGLMNPPLRFDDEFARHKLLDLMGDLALLGCRVRGNFEIEKGGHAFHVELAKKWRDSLTQTEHAMQPMDINEIQSLIPHRYPFLLVDRITGLDPKVKIEGFKNISMGEQVFQGHFPGHPIYPGVLIIEGMAQIGGVLIMKSFPELQGKLTYFMGIDNARFRRPVVPGDVLRYVVEVLKVKGPVTRLKGSAYVGDELASEAELLCMVVDREKQP